jgi:TolB-like protein
MTPFSCLSAEAIRDQLERLRRSAAFAGSDKLFAFLHFVVEETLERDGASLKEWVIGNAVYGRDPPYDPRIDSTVRVEARRLRRKLAEHYEGAGRLDGVLITLPVGGYLPSFAVHSTALSSVGASPSESGAPTLAILPFRALSARDEDAAFADGLTDEVIFLAANAGLVRVAPRMVVFQYRDRRYGVPALARELGVTSLTHGALRCSGKTIRVTLELCDASGFVVWSDRLDAVGEDRLGLQETLAASIWQRLARYFADRAPETEMGSAPFDAHSAEPLRRLNS